MNKKQSREYNKQVINDYTEKKLLWNSVMESKKEFERLKSIFRNRFLSDYHRYNYVVSENSEYNRLWFIKN